MKKIIISDLDGTLLTKDKTIYSGTKKAIAEATKKGVLFAIASGRAIDECLVVIKALGLKSFKNIFIIANNGAAIYDVENKRIIGNSFIPNSLSTQIFEYMQKFSLKSKDKIGGHIHNIDPKTSKYDAKSKNADFSKPQTFSWWNYDTTYNLTGPKGENLYTNNWPKKIDVKNITSVSNIKNITKFVFYFENEADKKHIMKQLSLKFKKVDCFQSAPDNIEVAPKGINKGSAVKAICKILDFKMSEALVFGDNFNDVPMFKVADAVTLSTAPEGVKKYAKKILPFDASIFVEKGINEIILNKK
ncbi:MAG: Cof-type HAD-IIB family hydrolase [Mycoplasmoidaceae bacterium]|nr:MAG: Cof-type HAD-IIB family hydrolase [Mycoplasmoidaceae bacterium]